MENSSRYIPKPSPDKKTRHTSQSKPFDMDLTDFIKYKSDGSRVRNRHIPCSGIVTLHLYGGRKMMPSLTSKRDTRDLYAVIEVDSVHKAQTATVTGRDDFCWDERFEIDLEKSHDLSILMYNYNSWEPDAQRKPCCRGVVRFSQLLMQAQTKDEVFKLGLRMEPRGVTYMVLTFTERHATLKRVPSLDRKGLFGVQLDVVVQREGSGCNIPILVQKCIGEIEDRGLNYVGVYRVCGSAKRKKRLREEFDTSSVMVDLSRDNYPDINVITGKLFCFCLFYIFVYYLFVCLLLVCLFICMFVYFLFVCLFVGVFISCLFVCLFICMFVYYLFVCLFICLFVCLFVWVLVWVFV